ncbi:MAG: aldehyde dehydrogenase family protein [Deinococcales bacterium]
MTQKLASYACGQWFRSESEGQVLYDASYQKAIASISSEGLKVGEMLRYGREVGGKALRKLNFHERALLLKKLASYLLERKEAYYELSYTTGATRYDGWVDIEGGIGTLFSYASLVRRELPNEHFLTEGEAERLSRAGSFWGRHLLVPKEGVVLHINAFNFPCWGMLEKLAPTLAAGMPAIIKPASATAYLTERIFQDIIASEILPEGAVQLICGSTHDIFDHLREEDVVTFTGSAQTGRKLKSHPNILEHSIPFNMEADSLNAIILGESVEETSPEFDLFIKEVAKEMTVKAGQKCTAIRRIIVPKRRVEVVSEALRGRLLGWWWGSTARAHPHGAPSQPSQAQEVQENLSLLCQEAEIIFKAP